MSNPDRGRPFSDVWEYMIKGQQQSRRHYTATCTYCNCTWKHGKPCVLRQHLANHCKNCPQDVALYFARIVGQKMGEDEDDENDTLDGWTDPRGNSLWAFMLLTGSRKEYLWSLEDLSSTKHTGQHIANVIDEF
ncbi:unnamed protein product [Rhizophagus irregularis]|uniref:BED-type domain-containing protein n=1 Tax=Rhizophagus irregularis TaxID=588596 RepID=A0A915ZLY1_9GLOM|nr:unnamed protein product [Rhizophagus irregularis]